MAGRFTDAAHYARIFAMNWKNKKVLVTGAGGFIGSHLTELLVESGAKVRAFVRYNSRSDSGFIQTFTESVKDKLEVCPGDLNELDTVEKAVDGCEYVFHLAALPGIPYSYLHPYEVFQTNTIGTLNVLTALRGSKILKRVVITSTSEVYGTARYAPIDENHPLQAQSPYSASKIASDKIGESFYKSFETPVAIARPFNAFGPRQSTRAVIPTIITQALTKKFIELGDLRPTRDFTYARDLGRGFMMIAENPKAVGEVINLGSGKEISIGDLAEKIIELTGRRARIKTDKQRLRPAKSEVHRLIADNTKARQILGWEPEHSLDEGLKKTIAWIKSNLKIYQPDVYHV